MRKLEATFIWIFTVENNLYLKFIYRLYNIAYTKKATLNRDEITRIFFGSCSVLVLSVRDIFCSRSVLVLNIKSFSCTCSRTMCALFHPWLSTRIVPCFILLKQILNHIFNPIIKRPALTLKIEEDYFENNLSDQSGFVQDNGYYVKTINESDLDFEFSATDDGEWHWRNYDFTPPYDRWLLMIRLLEGFARGLMTFSLQTIYFSAILLSYTVGPSTSTGFQLNDDVGIRYFKKTKSEIHSPDNL